MPVRIPEAQETGNQGLSVAATPLAVTRSGLGLLAEPGMFAPEVPALLEEVPKKFAC